MGATFKCGLLVGVNFELVNGGTSARRSSITKRGKQAGADPGFCVGGSRNTKSGVLTRGVGYSQSLSGLYQLGHLPTTGTGGGEPFVSGQVSPVAIWVDSLAFKSWLPGFPRPKWPRPPVAL